MIVSSQNCPFVVLLQWNENGDTPLLSVVFTRYGYTKNILMYYNEKKIWIVEVVFFFKDMNDLNFHIDRSATGNVVQFWSLSLRHATPWERVHGQLFAHVSMRSSFSYFSSYLPLRLSLSRKPQCFNVAVDSHSLVNEKYREMFPEYDRGFIDALSSAVSFCGLKFLLKKEQIHSVNNCLKGRDGVVNLPTGYGKSLCYTLCPLTTDNFCSLTRKEQRSILILHPSLFALLTFIGVDFSMASRWSQSALPLLKLPASFSYVTWHVICLLLLVYLGHAQTIVPGPSLPALRDRERGPELDYRD